jgi:hypothetical protein
LNSLFNCRNERNNLEAGKELVAPYLSPLSQTSVTYSSGNSQASLTLTFNGTSPPQPQVAFLYECYDNVYDLGSITATSDHFFYYVVSVDLFITVLFIVFFCSEVEAEDKEIKHFKVNQVGLNDFAVQVEGLNRGTLEKELT